MIPLDITYTDFEPSEAVSETIKEKVEKLEKHVDRIISCRVVVAAPHKHHKNKIYHIQIQLNVPGTTLMINREPEKNPEHHDVYLAIRDAFNAMSRKLEDFVRKRRDNKAAIPVPPES